MRNLITILALFVVCALSAQSTSTNSLSVGAGLFEQQKVAGVSLALQTELNHEITRNFGLTAGYTYVRQQYGDGRTIYIMGEPIKAPSGQTFNQLSLLVNYKFYTNDERLSIRTGFGAVNDFNITYTTAQLDLIAFANSNIYPYLSWQPVFGGVDGWSHTVTLNLAIKI